MQRAACTAPFTATTGELETIPILYNHEPSAAKTSLRTLPGSIVHSVTKLRLSELVKVLYFFPSPIMYVFHVVAFPLRCGVKCLTSQLSFCILVRHVMLACCRPSGEG
uniref:Uncharacterized protein n=1 Tax=Arundo donax TaxID=35708 RepID=A0A0A9G553_ARUDO